jgi:hypothetical protein
MNAFQIAVRLLLATAVILYGLVIAYRIFGYLAGRVMVRPRIVVSQRARPRVLRRGGSGSIRDDRDRDG